MGGGQQHKEEKGSPPGLQREFGEQRQYSRTAENAKPEAVLQDRRENSEPEAIPPHSDTPATEIKPTDKKGKNQPNQHTRETETTLWH